MSLIIESHRHVTGDAVVLGVDILGQSPGTASVLRVRRVHVVLKYADHLLGISWIHRDRRFGKRTRRGGQREDLRLRNPGQLLAP